MSGRLEHCFFRCRIQALRMPLPPGAGRKLGLHFSDSEYHGWQRDLQSRIVVGCRAELTQTPRVPRLRYSESRFRHSLDQILRKSNSSLWLSQLGSSHRFLRCAARHNEWDLRRAHSRDHERVSSTCSKVASTRSSRRISFATRQRSVWCDRFGWTCDDRRRSFEHVLDDVG